MRNSMKSDTKFSFGGGNIYKMGSIVRSIAIWIGFQMVMWAVFLLSFIINKESWFNVITVEPSSAAVGGWWTTILFVTASNLFICLLIIGGNIFVRFSMFTPGLAILFLQAISIGWLAGSNGFEIPFTNTASANIQFLKVGLWETTAYSLVCAVTLPKSLYISETFPAKVWAMKHKLKDLNFNNSEIALLVLSGIALISASIIETFTIFN